ncbi:autotransporter assembly complex family protein [Methylosinus sp. Ce-a6]|uniref:autotransporter assembly complex protein TamA n=1 Tax=Methylosinus sp. Ce-a6 TaxID=2172005 RepID=UPI001358534F|nr:autotransporter assembly complex family protein [Methylosinus sp. Ce-a6]
MKIAKRFLSATALLAFGGLEAASPVRAFDLFGLFGAAEEAPEPSPDSLPYKIEFAGLDEAEGLARSLQDVSNTWRLRLQAPPSGAGLARRVVADFPRLAEALWASGYYDAEIRATIVGVPVRPDGHGADVAAAAAERLRGQALAPIRMEIVPGPLFRLRKVAILDARDGKPLDAALLTKKSLQRDAEEPARAAALQSMQAAWIDALRANSFPLAKVVAAKPTISHPEKAMDVVVTIDPGPRAGIGEVRTSGSPGIDPDVIRSFIYLEEGEPYSPKKLADLRKSIGRLEAVGSVKAEDGETLDANGNLPIFVQTSERKRHAVGADAFFSNVDGPGLRAYWTDRNLFGGAERLRFDIEGGLAPFGSSASYTGLSSIRLNDVIGRAKASFVKPALFGSREDLLLDAGVVREKTDYYWAYYGAASASIRHRFSDSASVQAGLEFERGHSFDAFGPHDYSLLGFPLSANYDGTDDLLAPTNGFRAVANVTPYVRAFGDSVGMAQSKTQISGYKALDDDGWHVLAGRVAAGSILGASIENIPASHRFFAGGGGSVRGYRYRSLSPDAGLGFPVGGRSLLEGSVEARIKVTREIGIVPFYDIGSAFSSPVPDFRSSMRSSVGLGLRYYTGIGPIRLDVATPLGRRPGENRFAIFIGVGESF